MNVIFNENCMPCRYGNSACLGITANKKSNDLHFEVEPSEGVNGDDFQN